MPVTRHPTGTPNFRIPTLTVHRDKGSIGRQWAVLVAADIDILTEKPVPPTSVSGTIFVVRRDRFQQLSVVASHA